MSEKDMDSFLACCSMRAYAPQEYIFSAGQPAEQFYLLIAGKVDLEIAAPQHQNIVIDTIASGEALGWSWLFPPYVWQFNARAKELTETILIETKCLLQLCENDPRFGYEFQKRVSRVMNQRLQATRHKVLDLYAAKS
jgi:CRP-like cAMP-binding protein